MSLIGYMLLGPAGALLGSSSRSSRSSRYGHSRYDDDDDDDDYYYSGSSHQNITAETERVRRLDRAADQVAGEAIDCLLTNITTDNAVDEFITNDAIVSLIHERLAEITDSQTADELLDSKFTLEIKQFCIDYVDSLPASERMSLFGVTDAERKELVDVLKQHFKECVDKDEEYASEMVSEMRKNLKAVIVQNTSKLDSEAAKALNSNKTIAFDLITRILNSNQFKSDVFEAVMRRGDKF